MSIFSQEGGGLGVGGDVGALLLVTEPDFQFIV